MRIKIIFTVICIAAMILSGCAITGENTAQNFESFSNKISSLESRVSELERNRNEADAYDKKELEDLRAELEALKRGESALTVTSVPSESDIFLYSEEGGKATITGYSGSHTFLAIPTQIDSCDVVKIGKSAFASSKLTGVIIGEGVESIDRFAFYNSAFLSEVTIPSSVTNIGYSAFDGCSSRLTVYCHENSYAHSYAKSYGISYVII